MIQKGFTPSQDFFADISKLILNNLMLIGLGVGLPLIMFLVRQHYADDILVYWLTLIISIPTSLFCGIFIHQSSLKSASTVKDSLILSSYGLVLWVIGLASIYLYEFFKTGFANIIQFFETKGWGLWLIASALDNIAIKVTVLSLLIISLLWLGYSMMRLIAVPGIMARGTKSLLTFPVS